jgi:predicted SAM-dependent methyltransferase
VLPYCQGKGIDIGCGPDPITSDVIKWDFPDGDAYDLSGFSDETFDFLFSSHCLEHLFFQAAVLSEWMRVIKVGGKMILYLPHPDFYFNIGWGANADHCHDCYPEEIIRKLRSTRHDFRILSLQEFGPASRDGEWSFQLIVQKENFKHIE